MAAARGDRPPTRGLSETMRRVAERKDLETRKQLSERTGISESKLSKIWNLQALPNRTEAVRIWKELGVDPGLWDIVEPPDEPQEATGS